MIHPVLIAPLLCGTLGALIGLGLTLADDDSYKPLGRYLGYMLFGFGCGGIFGVVMSPMVTLLLTTPGSGR